MSVSKEILFSHDDEREKSDTLGDMIARTRTIAAMVNGELQVYAVFYASGDFYGAFSTQEDADEAVELQDLNGMQVIPATLHRK